MDETTPLPTPPEALFARLSSLGIAYQLYHHEAVFTAKEAAHLKETIPAIHIKNLFLKDKKDHMALVVLPDEINLDLKTLAPAIGLDRISFGSPDRLWKYLGVRPGSVCPFAVINDTGNEVRVIVHEAAAKAGAISVHPMLNTMSVTISGPDLLRFLDSIGHPPTLLNLEAFAKAAA
jgi:Ala-tRNA(Pro) deacylase